MKFMCTRNILLSAIRNLLSLTSIRSTLPILANALLETTPTGLKVLGTDLETGFQGVYDGTVQKPGRVTVNARALGDVLKELDPEHPITWQADDKHVVKLASGNSRFTLHGLPADDYPQLPAFDEPAQFSIPSTDFLTCLQQVLPAVPDQDQRFVLQSVLISISAHESPAIELVGTDGHRLVISESRAGRWVTSPPQQFNALIPKKAAQLLATLLAQDDTLDVPIAISKKLFCVTVKNVILTSRLVEGTYPNYQQVIPILNGARMEIDREIFEEALHRVAIISRDQTQAVRLALTPDTLTIHAQNADVGEGTESIPAVIADKEFKAGFNARYLLDALRTCPGKRLQLHMKEPLSPCVIVCPDGQSGWKHVIMPVR
ncbi:DNA polymerase III subunit beta [Nitrospira moscoviensis]|uniref:Beta sliding clamp n=1 Tax=Nitrospira moscoviensis TaxID=42253 RepID=A0A0K2GAK4_NITMO|nr:DNA polymerase III subunit beta [Nitrospira moscoviensis]ALA57970.1 putative DNA polymerase III subunit beta [Nitrospira moscoviensis]